MAIQPPNPPRTWRILELDALRGLAALAVVLFHYTTRFDELFGYAAPPLFSFSGGGYGVDLFFMLSGFVILMTLERTRRPGDFIVGRFSRLYPTYWACLVLTFLTVAAVGLPGQQVGLRDALLNGTMLQQMLGAEHVDEAYWSLQVELLFYVAMLVLYRFGAFRRPLTTTLLWTALCLVVHTAATTLGETLPTVAGGLAKVQTLLSLRYFPEFAVGIVLYDARRRGALSPRHVLAIAVALAVHGAMDSWASAAVLSCLAAVLYLATSGRLAVVAARPLVFLGAISYPLYLTHQNIGYVLLRATGEAGIPPAAGIAMAITLSILLAWLIARWVERPAMSAIRGWWKSHRERSAVRQTSPAGAA